MRQMFELVNIIGQQASLTIANRIKTGSENVYEFKELARKFTVDAIASCAFGIEINSFQNENNDFLRASLKMADLGSSKQVLKILGTMFVPWFMRAMNIKFFDNEASELFKRLIKESMKAREENGIVRHDMINLLLQAKKGNLTHEKEAEKFSDGFATVKESQVGRNLVERKWTDDYLTGQCVIFLIAG